MQICNDCGNIFDEDEIFIMEEHHPYGMGYATEEFGYCPYCHSDDFDDAKKCSRCENWVAETKDGLCDECYGEMNE